MSEMMTSSAQLAHILLIQATDLEENGNTPAAVELYQELIRRFRDNPDLSVRTQVAWAMLNYAFILAEDDDLSGFQALITRFDNAKEPAILEPLVWAMYHYACALGRRRDIAGANAGYQTIADRYGNSPEPAVMEQVAWARFHIQRGC